MGVFNKTPYTNFHELNLNWIIKKIKEVAADNAFFKQFFKDIEDEHILGVVTKVTENNDNTVKTDYLNEDTQQMDNYTAYNKAGTDGAISGAVTPIATRVTSAEGRLDDAEDDITSLQNGKLDKTAIQPRQITAQNITLTSGTATTVYTFNLNAGIHLLKINVQQRFSGAFSCKIYISGTGIDGNDSVNQGIITINAGISQWSAGSQTFLLNLTANTTVTLSALTNTNGQYRFTVEDLFS